MHALYDAIRSNQEPVRHPRETVRIVPRAMLLVSLTIAAVTLFAAADISSGEFTALMISALTLAFTSLLLSEGDIR